MNRARRLAAAGWSYARTRVRWRSLLPVILFGLSILFTVHYVAAANHKFCQVVSSVTTTRAAKPADPASNPSREKQYELYQKFASLSNSLGC